LFLSRGIHGITLPKEEELFEVYDFAFANTFFGHV
jgi:hypothetical protein